MLDRDRLNPSPARNADGQPADTVLVAGEDDGRGTRRVECLLQRCSLRRKPGNRAQDEGRDCPERRLRDVVAIKVHGRRTPDDLAITLGRGS